MYKVLSLFGYAMCLYWSIATYGLSLLGIPVILIIVNIYTFHDQKKIEDRINNPNKWKRSSEDGCRRQRVLNKLDNELADGYVGAEL